MTALHTLRTLKVKYAPLYPLLREDVASCILAYLPPKSAHCASPLLPEDVASCILCLLPPKKYALR